MAAAKSRRPAAMVRGCTPRRIAWVIMIAAVETINTPASNTI